MWNAPSSNLSNGLGHIVVDIFYLGVLDDDVHPPPLGGVLFFCYASPPRVEGPGSLDVLPGGQLDSGHDGLVGSAGLDGITQSDDGHVLAFVRQSPIEMLAPLAPGFSPSWACRSGHVEVHRVVRVLPQERD